MKNYDISFQPADRKQVVEVTLQSGLYKGIFKLKPIGGNCLGFDILTSNNFEDNYCFDDIEEGDINLSISEDSYGELRIKYYLKKDNGDICEYEEKIDDLREKIVKLEIVSCEVLGIL